MNGSRIIAVLALLTGSSAPSTAPGATPSPRLTVGESRSVLPFIADDYTRALAEARARKVPLFIESWAPW